MNETMNETSFFTSDEAKAAVFAAYDQLLEEWGQAHEIDWVPTRFGKTHVISMGNRKNPGLVLLHGSGSNSSMWLADMIVYAQDFRVHAVDIVGQPGKSAEVRPDLKSEGYAEWLKDVVIGLGYDEVAVVGNSLGGWVAIRFASSFPNRVTHLGLIATSGVSPVKLSSTIKMIWHAMRGPKGMLRLQELIMDTDEIGEEAAAYMTLMSTSFRPLVDALPVFSDEELSRLTMPVQFVGGANDFFVDSAKTAERLETILPQARTMVIADNGHVVVDATATMKPFLKDEV